MVDFDMLVLAVSAFKQLIIDKQWITFSPGKYLRYLSAHEMAHALVPQMSIVLPFVHAFNGCDTVAIMLFRTWKENCVECMGNILSDHISIQRFGCMTRCHEHLQQLEHFVVLVYYHHTSTDVTVKEGRKTFFSQNGLSMNNHKLHWWSILREQSIALDVSGHRFW